MRLDQKALHKSKRIDTVLIAVYFLGALEELSEEIRNVYVLD